VQRCYCAEQMTAAAGSPDGCLVVGGGASGTLYIWNASSGRLLTTLRAHNKVSKCLSSMPWMCVCGDSDPKTGLAWRLLMASQWGRVNPGSRRTQGSDSTQMSIRSKTTSDSCVSRTLRACNATC
jgi:WD40 repeat protein